jgi:NADH-quinone oxidoreductase subunit M
LNALPFETLVLNFTWIFPLGVAGILAALPSGNPGAVRKVSVAAAGANLLAVLWLTLRFAAVGSAPDLGSTRTSLAFAQQTPWIRSLGAEYFIGVDAISMFLMLLAAVIVFCGTLASLRIQVRVKEFFILLQVLAAGTFGSFMAFDLLLFFFFNELTLIPTYLLIARYGSGHKEYAAMKLTLLLVAGSALVLAGFLGAYFEAGARTFNLLDLSQMRFDPAFQRWAFPAVFLGFAVLGNLFPFHVWSPDGHAAAPTAVSMFLAGVHMKIGSYGCLRMALYLFPEGGREWAGLFFALAVAGTLWGAFVAVRQRDFKYMNAYASVSHCALAFIGLCALNAMALRGAVLQMLSHGLITAAVFCLIGMIYERTRTRAIPEMGGLMRTMPFLGVCLVLAGFAALGLPGFSGFAAELNIFLGGFLGASPWMRAGTFLAVGSVVVAAVYMLRAVNAVLHGPLREPAGGQSAGLSLPADAGGTEKIALCVLLAGILLLGIFPGWVADRVDESLLPILNNLNRK